jgi:hypothetical protein
MESRPQVMEGVQRLKGAFLQVPGTHLTLIDAATVSGLDHPLCEVVLGALEEVRFLKRTDDGRYQRWALDSPDS